MKETLGERLKKAMDEKKLTQADVVRNAQLFAKKIGTVLYTSEMANYVNDKSVPSGKKLQVLCYALNVSPNYLLGIEDDDILTEEEEILLNCWRKASYEHKKLVTLVLAPYGMDLIESRGTQEELLSYEMQAL